MDTNLKLKIIKSVRWRLFIGVSTLMIFFIISLWALNTLYLEKYYAYKKEQSLIEIFTKINSIYKGDPYAIELELEKTGRTSGLGIIIINNSYVLKYNSLPKDFKHPERRRELDVPLGLIAAGLPGLDNKPYYIAVSKDERLDTNFMYLLARFSNGDFLVLSTPLVAIQQNVQITNQFILFTGIFVILLGMIAIYFFARRFTKPITELNTIAQGMAKLDFSKKYDVITEDEIGELGQSINSLSEQLDKSINELKEANRKLKEDIERERRIDDMRKEFISSVSHELKTPITLIQGYAEGLKVNVVEDEESKNYYCEVIMDEAKKMGKLVKDLLELAYMESGQFKLEQEAFDISALIEKVMEKYKLLFKEKAVILHLNIENNQMVYGDPVRIEQVLINFINNAVNNLNEQKIIEVTVKDINGDVRVSIFNTGNFIPENTLDMIWKSFYKLDKARTREYGGTGLGLSIVRAILELHGAKYGVLNKENGVEFWFEISKAK